MLFAVFLHGGFGNLSQMICRLSCSVPSLRIYTLAHIPKGIKSFTYSSIGTYRNQCMRFSDWAKNAT